MIAVQDAPERPLNSQATGASNRSGAIADVSKAAHIASWYLAATLPGLSADSTPAVPVRLPVMAVAMLQSRQCRAHSSLTPSLRAFASTPAGPGPAQGGAAVSAASAGLQRLCTSAFHRC